MREAGKCPRIAVIGAGFAGLRAADVLVRSGASVTVYEARNRVGGRVHQDTLAGRAMDMGANWIHGTDHNPIMSLATKTNTTIHEFDGRMTIFDSEGTPMADEEAQELFEATWSIIGQAFEYSDKNKSVIDPDQSLFDFFKERVHEVTSDRRKQSMILKLSQEWGAFVGDPVDRQSLKFFFLESTIEGETAFVAGTYTKILGEVAKVALEKAEVRFNSEVTKIESAKSTATGQISVSISTADSTETYDEVVVTCPLGYLQQRKATLFSEPLPPPISQAIDNIHYGHLEKCYITFSTAWWRQDEVSTSMPSASVTDVHPAATSSEKSRPSSAPPQFFHYLSPDYVDHPVDIAWNQELVDMSLFPGSTAQPTLLFYTYGPCGGQLVRSLKDIVPHSAEYNSILDRFFRPYYSLLPSYSNSNPACTPKAFLATQWQNDPLAGNGSYTNFQIPSTSLDEDIITIREAKGTGSEKGIWFAGEHTSPFIALGTTTGAYWSGEAVAKKLCGLWGLRVPADVVAEGQGFEEGTGMDERARMHGAKS